MSLTTYEFADKVTHVTLTGRMLSGAEIWQTGFYMGKAAGGADEPNQAFADNVRDKWLTFWTNGSNGVSQFYTFEEVKCARLGKDGKYDGSAVVTSHPAVATAGGSGGNALPPQVSLVATLIAGSGKGLAGKGRMYLPGINFPISNTGHLGTLETQTICTSLATFFQAMYDDANTTDVPINASRGHIKFFGAGARNVPINGVRVGDVYDTQRRRRDAIQESYKVSGLIGP